MFGSLKTALYGPNSRNFAGADSFKVYGIACLDGNSCGNIVFEINLKNSRKKIVKYLSIAENFSCSTLLGDTVYGIHFPIEGRRCKITSFNFTTKTYKVCAILDDANSLGLIGGDLYALSGRGCLTLSKIDVDDGRVTGVKNFDLSSHFSDVENFEQLHTINAPFVYDKRTNFIFTTIYCYNKADIFIPIALNLDDGQVTIAPKDDYDLTYWFEKSNKICVNKLQKLAAYEYRSDIFEIDDSTLELGRKIASIDGFSSTWNYDLKRDIIYCDLEVKTQAGIERQIAIYDFKCSSFKTIKTDIGNVIALL